MAAFKPFTSAKHAARASCLLAAAAAIAGALAAPAYAQSSYTWTQNSAATQTWTTTGNWANSTAFVSGTGNGLVFFSNTTSALVTGNNLITGSVPATLSMNTLTLNGLGSGSSNPTNITIATNASTWTLGGGTTSTVNLNGVNGVLRLNYTVAPNLTLNSATTTFTGNGSAYFVFSGNIGETSAGTVITKTGSSILTLSGTNNYSGGTIINGGAVSFLNTNARPATGTITVASGATLGLGVSGSNAFTSANVDSLFAGTLAGVTNDANSNVGIDTSGSSFTYSTSVASTTRGLTKLGTNTLTLSGSNAFSRLSVEGPGAVSLTNSNAAGTGTIFLKSTNGFGGGTTLAIGAGVTIANPIQVDLTLGRQAIEATGGAGNASLAGNITAANATVSTLGLYNNLTSGTFTVSGNITGSGIGVSLRGNSSGRGILSGTVTASNALNINGATNWIISSTGNTWTTTDIQSSGNLVLGANDALPTGALINFNNAAAATGGVDLNGFNQTVPGLVTTSTPTTGNGGLITNGGSADSTLTLAGMTADRTFLGRITDGPTNKTSLVMNSAGRTQTLSGSIGNTFSGSTVVSAGTLALAHNLALQNSLLNTTGTGVVAFSSVTTPTIGGLSGTVNLATKFGTGFSSVTALTLNPQVGVTGTYSGVISDGAAGMTLTKTGSGTQVLSGTNTYTGTTAISTGALSITATSALPGWDTAGRYSVAGGAILAVSNAVTDANIATMIGTGNFQAGAAIGFDTSSGNRTYAVSQADGGSALALAKIGSGTLTLTGSNSYTGGTLINAGVLQIGSSGTVGTLGSGAVTNNGNLAFSRTDAYGGTVSNVISGTGSVTLASGTLTLSGSNGYTGGTTLNAGILKMGSATALGGNNAAVTVAAGAVLDLAGITGTSSNRYAVTINGSGISGGGALINSTGTAATLFGPVTLGSDSTISPTSQAINLGNSSNASGISGAYALTVAGAAQLDVFGNIQTTSVTLAGSALRLESDNSFAGGLTIKGGEVIAKTVKALGGSGTGTVYLGDTTGSSGAVLSLGANGTYANPIIVQAGNTGSLRLGNYGNYTVTVSSSVTLNKSLTLDSGNATQSFTISGPISGVGGLTIQSSGTSTVALSGSNTFSGITTMSSANPATLQLGNVWALQNSTLDTGTSGNQSVAFTAAGTNTYFLGGLQGSDDLAIGANTISVGGNNANTTFAAAISGSGGLTKIGSGTLTLSGNNPFTGAATISAGILSITGTSGLAGTSGVNIAGGAGLTYSGGTATFDRNITVTAGSGTGTIRNSGGGLLTLAGNLSKDNSVLRLTGGRFDVTGQITGTTVGASDLLVDGTSTVTLSAANTYSGPTFVNQASNLIVGINNAIPNDSMVTLGNATTRGTLTLGTNTDSISQLVFSGSGGTLSLSGDKTASPQLATNGSLALGSNSSLVLTSAGTSAGLYRLISYTSLTGSFSPSNITGTPTGYSLLYTGTEIDLQQNAVFGTLSVTNPTAIITGGSAAFTYTVSNAAFSGGATLSFSGSGSSNVAGSSSGSALAGGTSSAISGLVFTGTTTGAGRTGTFSVTGAGTTQTGTVAVDVYGHASGSLSGNTIRVADSIVGYSGTLAGLTTATASNGAGYLVSLKTLGTTSAGGVSINNVSGVAAGSSATISAAVVTGSATGINAVNQQFTLTYADDSTLAGASNSLGSGTVTVQGNVFGHAAGSATGATIALADSIVGYTGSLAGLTSATISNAAGYRVNLMTTGGTSAGFVNINNVSGIAAGSSATISAAALLTGSQAVGSNSLGQSFNLTYADDSALAGASSNLGSQSITVTGNVYDHASGSLSGGTIRVADSIVGYSGTLAGLTTASVGNAAGYRVNLKTLGTTSAGGVSINNVSGVAAGGSSTISAAVVTGTGFGANAVNQQFTLTYADDSTLAGALSSGLGSGTVTVQGNVYGHASGSAAGATIALADSIVGYTGSLAGLTSATISNAAGYRVNLMTTGGTSAGFVNINNVSGIAAGSSATISAAALLTGSQAVGSNSLGQSFNLTYADDSALAGASSNLGSQTVTVTGKVLDHATSSLAGTLLTGTTISLGQYNYATNTWESGGPTGLFSIFNLASSFGASLTADLSLLSVTGTGNGFTTNLASYSTIAGGTSSQFSIFFDPSGLSSSTTKSTTFQIAMSDKTGMAGATSTNTLSVTAQVIVVPEPGAIALAGIGIATAMWALRRRK